MCKGLPGIKQGMWKPVHVNMKESREETEMALFACIRHVLKRTGIKASQVNNLQESHLDVLGACLVALSYRKGCNCCSLANWGGLGPGAD